MTINSCSVPRSLSLNQFTFPLTLRDELKRYQVDPTSQARLESYLLLSAQCDQVPGNQDLISHYQHHLANIDDVKLAKLLNGVTTFNFHLHQQIECLLMSVIRNQTSLFSARERVTRWLTQLNQIGTRSLDSIAMAASVSHIRTDLFVVKTPRRARRDHLVHEAMIGILVMNRLRTLLPNYMYTYGYLQCAPTYLYPDNPEPVIWCLNQPHKVTDVSYLVTESIRSSLPLSDMFLDSTFTETDLIATLSQIWNALVVAFKSFSFTHYDLHSRNVLVRKFNQEISIPYYGSGDRIIGTIRSRYVPYLIDYGTSHVLIGSYSFGRTGLESGQVFSSRPFPLHDVYKLICSLGQYYLQRYPNGTDTAVYRICQSYFAFFQEGELSDRIQRRRRDPNDYYSLSSSWLTTPLDRFLEHVEISPYPPLISTRGLTFFSGQQSALSSCLPEKSSTNLTAFQYCQAPDDTRFSALTSWYSDFYPSYNHLVQDLLSLVEAPLPYLDELSLSVIFSSSFVTNYREQIVSLFTFKRDLHQLQIDYRSYLCAFRLQNSVVRSEETSQVDSFFTQAFDFLEEQEQIMKQNLELFHPTEEQFRFWRDEHHYLYSLL